MALTNTTNAVPIARPSSQQSIILDDLDMDMDLRQDTVDNRDTELADSQDLQQQSVQQPPSPQLLPQHDVNGHTFPDMNENRVVLIAPAAEEDAMEEDGNEEIVSQNMVEEAGVEEPGTEVEEPTMRMDVEREPAPMQEQNIIVIDDEDNEPNAPADNLQTRNNDINNTTNNNVITIDPSPDDFEEVVIRPRKRPRADEPEQEEQDKENGNGSGSGSDSLSSKKKEPEDLEDATTCTICFDPWTLNGSHRVCSLKCGHLFGYGCIEKWINQIIRKNRNDKAKCPTCNAPAVKRDIRPIFATKVIAVDTQELESARSEANELKGKRDQLVQEKARYEILYSSVLMQNKQYQEEIDRLKKEIGMLKYTFGESMKANDSNGSGSGGSNRNGVNEIGLNHPLFAQTNVPKRFVKLWHVTLGNPGDTARVMAFDPFHGVLHISRSSDNNTHHGIYTVNLSDRTHNKYLAGIHTKLIRDIKIFPASDKGLVLTVAVDRTMKLTNVVGSGSIVWSKELPSPGWSCCYQILESANADGSVRRQRRVFAGLANNSIAYFNIDAGLSESNSNENGNGSSENNSFNAGILNSCGETGGPGKGIHSLHYVSLTIDNVVLEGLLGASLGGVFFWRRKSVQEQDSEQWDCFALEFSVPPGFSCSSLSILPATDFPNRFLFLASFRSNMQSTTRHCLAKLSVDPTSQKPIIQLLRQCSGLSKQTRLLKSQLFMLGASDERRVESRSLPTASLLFASEKGKEKPKIEDSSTSTHQTVLGEVSGDVAEELRVFVACGDEGSGEVGSDLFLNFIILFFNPETYKITILFNLIPFLKFAKYQTDSFMERDAFTNISAGTNSDFSRTAVGCTN